MDGKHHPGILYCAEHLRNAHSAGPIIRQVLEYHDFIIGEAASLNDFADRIITIE